MQSAIVIRIKSNAGFSRVTVQGTDTFRELKEKVAGGLGMNMSDLQLKLNNEGGARVIALDNNQVGMISQLFNGV